MRRAALALLCAFACAFSAAAFSQGKKDKAASAPPPSVPENLAPADVDALLSQLTDAQARQLLARQLTALSDRQMVSLFASTRFAESSGHQDGRNAAAWATVLGEKIRGIVDGPECPATVPR